MKCSFCIFTVSKNAYKLLNVNLEFVVGPIVGLFNLLPKLILACILLPEIAFGGAEVVHLRGLHHLRQNVEPVKPELTIQPLATSGQKRFISRYT